VLCVANLTDAPPIWGVPHISLDAAVASALVTELVPLLVAGELILDLTEVQFADSSGISVLVRLHARCPGRFWIMNVSPALAACLKRAPADRLPPQIDPPPGWEPVVRPGSLMLAESPTEPATSDIRMLAGPLTEPRAVS